MMLDYKIKEKYLGTLRNLEQVYQGMLTGITYLSLPKRNLELMLDLVKKDIQKLEVCE